MRNAEVRNAAGYGAGCRVQSAGCGWSAGGMRSAGLDAGGDAECRDGVRNAECGMQVQMQVQIDAQWSG